MLDSMRRMTGTWIVRILFGLLILSFAAWGIGDVFRGRVASDNVAEVGDVPISRDELARQYRREIERVQRVMGPDFDSERAREMGLLDRTLDALVEGQLVAAKARDLGLIASDETVRRQIYEEPSFQTAAGVFDPNVFRRVLFEYNLSESAYIATLRAGLTRNQLMEAVRAGASVPSLMRDATYRYRGERRVAEYLTIPNASVPAGPEPTQDELAAFHAGNPALFSVPELREIVAIHLDPDEVAKDIAPSEEQIRDSYQQRLPSISVPERRRVRNMVLPDRDKAEAARAAIATGRSFDEVAKESAGQTEAQTNLGSVTQRELTPSLATVAFGLAEGAVGGPVESPLGWHLIQVEKIEPGRTPALEEARAEIVRELAREIAVADLVKRANQLEDELAGGAKLEEAAEKLGVKLVRPGPIDARGRTRTGTAVTGIPQDPRFIETAFRAQPDVPTALQETRAGGYYILRVDTVTPPALRPLDEVRSQVAAALIAKRREEAGRARAETLRDRARGGETLAKIGAELGLEAKTGEPITRFAAVEPNSPVPAQLVSELFKATVGDTVVAPYDGGFAIGKVKEIRPAVPTGAAADLARLESQLGDAIAGDLVAQFTRALRDRYPVSINQAALGTIQ